MTDWNGERVRALVSAAEDAVQRTRWVFLVLNLGCAIMITAQLNLYGTWVRNVHDRVVARSKADVETAKAELEKAKTEAEQAKTEVEKAEAEAKKVKAEAEKAEAEKKDVEVLRTIDKITWDDLYNVSMPLLGIKYSADDLIILGTAAMSVLALWFVYAHRRENHCINDLKDIAMAAKRKEPALTSYIYAAVAHHFVFTTTTQDDKAHGTTTKQNGETFRSEGTKTVLRRHVIFLIHLPWIASLMVVLVMAVSLFVPRLKLVVVPDRNVPAFFQFQPFEKFEAIARMVWGLACTLLTAYYCIQAQIYDRGTHARLVEMREAASGYLTNEEGTEK
jgi:hypothetical protein